MTVPTRTPAERWYREPWPWIVMVAPAAAVVGGAVMLWLALTTYDGLVSDDYYKEGLAINQVLRRDERAAELGYRAHASLSEDGTLVRVLLRRTSRPVSPQTVQLRLAHPTRAGHDQVVVLIPISSELYEARVDPPGMGRWRVSIEDTAGTWRLAGEWQLPQQRGIELQTSLPR